MGTKRNKKNKILSLFFLNMISVFEIKLWTLRRYRSLYAKNSVTTHTPRLKLKLGRYMWMRFSEKCPGGPDTRPARCSGDGHPGNCLPFHPEIYLKQGLFLICIRPFDRSYIPVIVKTKIDILGQTELEFGLVSFCVCLTE